MFDNVKMNGGWLQMQALAHELNKMYMPMQTREFQMEKRGWKNEFLNPTSGGHMTFY